MCFDNCHDISVDSSSTLYYMRHILNPGDFVLTTFPGSGVVSRVIMFFERMYSKDKNAFYTHAAFLNYVDVANDIFKVFDTRWSVETRYFFSSYRGSKVSIIRIKVAEPSEIKQAINYIAKDTGESYPVVRLILHMLCLADNIHWNKMVCSERVVKFGHLILRLHKIFDFERYYGWTPDNIYDFARENPDVFDIVFEGIC